MTAPHLFPTDPERAQLAADDAARTARHAGADAPVPAGAVACRECAGVWTLDPSHVCTPCWMRERGML